MIDRAPIIAVAAGALAGLGAASVAAQSVAAPMPPIIAGMSGDWDVSSRMWQGPGLPAQEQPMAVAHRDPPPGGGVVEERLASTAGGPPFTRLATIDYNAAERVFEYASMDTRAPQLMHYRSQIAGPTFAGPLRFAGGTFVLPEWGKWRNTRFAYRIELSAVANDRQTLRIYFRPQTRVSGPEFLATQYDYVRRRTP